MGSSFHATVTFFGQIWPKINSFGSRVYQIKISFSRRCFLSITFWYKRYENKNDTIVFSPFEAYTFWSWKANFKIWPQVRSGQVRARPWPKYKFNIPKRLNELNRLAPFARLYLHPVATYWRKTDYDLIRPHLTSGDIPVTPIVSCARIITEKVSQLAWPGDPWPRAKNFKECLQWMLVKSLKF